MLPRRISLSVLSVLVTVFPLALNADTESQEISGTSAQTEKSPEWVIREFLSAMRTGNLNTLKQVTLETPGIERLAQRPEGRRAPSAEELNAELEQLQIERFNAEGNVASESKRQYVVTFRGMVSSLNLHQIDGKWKVDARWWLASGTEPSKSDITVRWFMYAMITRDAATLSEVAAPHPNLWALSYGDAPPDGEMAHYYHLCAGMALVPLERGEIIINLAGQPETVGESHLSAHRKLLVGLFGVSFIPIQLKLVEDKWRVDASDWIQKTIDRLSDQEKKAGGNAYATQLKDGFLDRTFQGQGDLEGLKKLLATDLSDEQKNTALHKAVHQFWTNNEVGELPDGSVWIQMADALLQSGADPNHVSTFGELPLTTLASTGNGFNGEMVELLLKHGADPALKDESGRSASELIYTQRGSNYGHLIEAVQKTR